MKKIFYSMVAAMAVFSMPVMAQNDLTEVAKGFENLDGITLNADGYYLGEKKGKGVINPFLKDLTTYDCKYYEGPLLFQLDYTLDSKNNIESFTGIAISKRTDNSAKYPYNYYNNVKGGGYNSETFGIINGNNTFIELAKDTKIKGLYVNNSAYTLEKMLNGDSYAPALNKDGDYFKLVIEGFAYGETEDDDDTKLAQKEVTMAEFKDGSLQYIKDWTWVDLADFMDKNIDYVIFSFNGSASETPPCACIDNITLLVPPTQGIEGVVSKDSNAMEVARYNANGVRLNAPQHGLNIVKMSDGTTRKEMIK